NLYHKFYSTYEFDEVCADDELRTKKIIKFRLCGRAFSWTLVEFAKRLGLYHPQEIEEDGFDVYFQGGLRSDEHFNTREYWLSISQVENISMLMSHASTIWKPVLRVLHKIISYGLCQRTTGYDKMQKTDLWLLSMFEAKHQNRHANVAWLIARWIKRKGVGAELFECSDYSRALETTMLKELIDSKGRLILEVREPGVPRVAIPRPSKALILITGIGMLECLSTWLGFIVFHYREPITHLDMISSISQMIMMSSDEMTRVGLIDSKGRLILEVREPGVPRVAIPRPPKALMYAGVFEHMAGVYSVPLQGAYNPPGYDQQHEPDDHDE
nr:hypothetical protein [Tanacetum cinerariifolium]